MGTITARKRKDGIIAHLTQVPIKRGAILHREHHRSAFSRSPPRRRFQAVWNGP